MPHLLHITTPLYKKRLPQWLPNPKKKRKETRSHFQQLKRKLTKKLLQEFQDKITYNYTINYSKQRIISLNGNKHLEGMRIIPCPPRYSWDQMPH